ncbi:MAG: cellulose synthase subunit BcsC-related outer membrane protein [Terracidiphilus sp.]
MNSGIARNPAERAAFAALNAHRLDEAERRFNALLQAEPNDGRVLAGTGFLRMQQKKFADAITNFTQAEQNGYKAKIVEDALATSRFWNAMNQATAAMDQNQFDVASAQFRAALDMNPHSSDALNGLAGLYLKQKQYLAAAGEYEQLIRLQPASFDGWRGLFLADAQAGENDKALVISARAPAQVRAALNRDPDYLRTLAAIYQAQGRTADAERILALALQLPFPGNGSTLEAGTKMQYAGILMEAKRFGQAAALYSQVVASDPADVSAWMGLISAHHELGQDGQSLSDVQRIPAATYETALNDPAFLSELGAIYQQANQFDVAQGMLERADRLETAAGKQPGIDLQLQLAGIYLLRSNTDQAYTLYRQIVTSHPDNAGAWKGLIAALAATNRNAQALQELAEIPAPVRKQLDSNIDFMQTEAGLYATTGNTARALQYMDRVLAYYAKTAALPPPSVAIQNAWILYNVGDDRGLYNALMHIGGRNDLTVEQRETVQSIWANWSVRRAAAAMDNGNAQHAVDILDAASLAFPNNLTVRKAVAGGYARVGRAKEALTLYKNIPMQDASAGDFEGAIGAALAANDRNQAELWLRLALERFPRDPVVLTLAGRYEQARGDNERAADYYRASIAAMPSVSPVDRLAHELVYPEQDLKTHRAVTAADLQHLLDPDYEPFEKTTKLPSLPAYGPDPYDGRIPVVSPAPQISPAGGTAPTTQDLPPPMPVPHASLDGAPASRPAAQNARLVLASFPISRHPFTIRSDFFRNAYAAPAAIQAAAQPYRATEITLNPPHSLASDAWKGLIFSLIAGNRNAEALAQLSKIPPDVRRQLEGDIEWVQGLASLYYSVGDMPTATYYLKRVETFYLLHPGVVPASLELQHAWLLYNIGNDSALYPVLEHLDARPDLAPEQRQQVQTIWANWAIRRAAEDMDNGNLPLGVEILQAASQDFPDNLNVRFAVAGAYMRAGRSQDALAIYKATSMSDASSSDYQGAIGAALAARDMAQAEIWLRVGLNRFPNNSNILGLAAQFEQARGNNKRATEFWRAALAAAPPDAKTATLVTGISATPGSPSSAAGDVKRLLDPRLNPAASPNQIAPLPSFQSQPSAPAAALLPLPQAAPSQDLTSPSTNPLPLPSASYSSGGVAAEQGTSGPVYVPHGTSSNIAPSGPVLVQQSATQQPLIHSASGNQASADLPPSTQFTGRMNLPPSEQNINSAAAPDAEPAGHAGSQLTQGSASVIHTVPNSPVSAPPAGPIEQSSSPASQGPYDMAQYTPSAQDAATGAFSAPKQQQSAAQPPAAAPEKPKPAATTPAKHRKRAVKPAPQTAQQPTQTLGNAPIGNAASGEAAPPAQAPEENPAETTTGTGLSDQELEQQNLPPLHGPWVRVRRQGNPISPREEAEEQLHAIEGGYSGWLGGTSVVNYRSGDPGYSQLAAIESPFEASAPLGYHARITAIAKPVFLDSGQADGTANISVLESQSGATCRVTIPEPIGTYAASQNFAPCTAPTIGALTPPAQQNAVGVGGELQLTFPHLAIAGGYTPANFLVSTFTARFQWKPGNGPITLSFNRDSEKDSQLSYAGLRDPAGNSLGTVGQIWGGVVDNQGLVQVSHGDAQSGFYFAAGGHYLTGYNVEKNDRVDGTGGAYWRVYAAPEFGNLSVGANFFAMHYANNQNAFTHGMGGYFSPQGYFLGNVPISWEGHYETHLHYNIMGALGAQAFQEDATPLWPLAGDKPLETSQNNPMLPNVTSISANYDLRSQVAYQIGPHWFTGAYLAANNTRNYSYVSAGFFVRYTFREQPSSATAPTGLFPADGFRPFTVP